MRIVAIGGGEIGRPGYDIETEIIDKEIINFSGKKNPKVLFIPTASSDAEGYCDVFKNYYGDILGCKIDFLLLLKEKLDIKEIEEKILSSDIIYVGGGNTLKMMTLWRKLGVDKILKKALEKDIVLCGISAGAICWFKYGNSDSRKFTSNSDKLIKVTGLGFINAFHCPHYSGEINRQSSLKEMMKKSSLVSIALDNCTAMQIENDKYRIVKSNKEAKAYKIYYKKGEYIKEEMSEEEFSNLENLLKK